MEFLKKHGKLILIGIFILIFLVITVVSLKLTIIYLCVSPDKLTNAHWLGFLGSFLSFIGSLFLGIVALMQTKKANKVSEQMVKLTENSNEIALINKIVTFESKRLEDLYVAFNQFLEAVNPQEINLKALECLPTETNEVHINIDKIPMFLQCQSNLELQFLNLARILRFNGKLDMEDNFTILLSAVFQSAKSLAEDYSKDLAKGSKDSFVDTKRLSNSIKIFNDFKVEKEKYYQAQEAKLKRVLFEKLTFEEIRNLYNQQGEHQ